MLLESFEDHMTDPAKPPEGFEQGHAEGYAEGYAAARSEQATLQHALVQNIADLEFKYEEARGEIIKSLAPLFSMLTEKLFPQLLADGFADQIAMILQQVASQRATTGLCLSVHPDQYDAVSATLSATSTNAMLSVDASLPANAAWVRHEQGMLRVDFDALLDEIRTILSAVEPTETRNDTHG